MCVDNLLCVCIKKCVRVCMLTLMKTWSLAVILVLLVYRTLSRLLLVVGVCAPYLEGPEMHSSGEGVQATFLGRDALLYWP